MGLQFGRDNRNNRALICKPMSRDTTPAQGATPKHTPGLWNAEHNSQRGWVVHNGKDFVCIENSGGSYRSPEERKANAELIARAPDLLAENQALREALRAKLLAWDQMRELLQQYDELLRDLEDSAHGSEGKRITTMRGKIQESLLTSTPKPPKQ
jgi:hypothetical protein